MDGVMFLDESGVHWHEPDSEFPVFVLGGVITDLVYSKTVVEDGLTALKVSHFGDPNVVLHTSEIVRNQGAFDCLKDAGKRRSFVEDLNALMRRLDYQVVACAIRKNERRKRYGDRASDPYRLCLSVLVERFCYEMKKRECRGWIVAECRRPDLDRQLLDEWQRLQRDGTRYVAGADIAGCVRGLLYREKSANIGGLQLADLVVSPIGRHVIGKPEREDFRIIESKFRRVDGEDYLGCGLVVLP